MRKCLPKLKLLTVVFALMLMASAANAATYFARQSGNWNDINTWSLSSGGPVAGTVPGLTDNASIPSTFNVTVTANASCATLTFTILVNPSPAGSLTVNAGFTLAVTGAIIKNNETQTASTTTITGGGTLTCGSFTLGGTNTAIAADHTITLTSSIAIFSISGNLNLNGEDNGANDMNPVFDIASGSVTVGGTINTDEENGSTVTLTMNNGGAETGTLTLPGATPFTNTTGSPTFDADGTAATVNYSGAAQTIFLTTYKNLTLSGSGIKSLGATAAASGNLTIGSGVTFQPTADLTFSIGGNFANAGILNADNGTSQMDITFNGTVNQSVTGAGSQTEFNRITINNTGALNNNIIEISAATYSIIPAGFLTLTDGVLKLSGTSTMTNTFFNTSGYTIPATAGLWINNANITVTGQGNTATLNGLLRVSAGTYNVGTGASDNLQYNTGASFTSDGGTTNIAGRFIGQAPTTDQIIFAMSGGTLNVANVGSNANNNGSFDIGNAGSSFTMSGGTIVLKNENTNGTALDYRNVAGTVNITGGTVQFGTATTAGSPSFVVGVSPTTNVFPSISIVKAVTATSVSLSTPISVRGNIDIAASTTFNANSQAIAVTGNTSAPGNWTNNGTFNPVNVAAAVVTFNSAQAQIIGGTSATTFNGITFNNTLPGTGIAITVSTGAFINGVATFTDGIVSTNSSLITFNNGSSVAAGTPSDASHIDGPIKKLGSAPGGTFRFPCGDAGQYEYLEIIATTAYDFTVQYLRTSATALNPNVTAPVKNVSGCDHWTLDPGTSVPTATIAVTLSWSDQFPCGTTFVTQPSSLTIAHLTGGSWVQAGTSGAGTGTSSSGSVTRVGVNSFSPFSLANTANNQNPLPVLFNNVKAFEKGSGVQIEWTNLTEKDVVNYSVERSVDGSNFTTISQLSARSNISDAQSYLSFDGAPAATNFYRIKVVEADGHIVYSKLMKVDIGKSQKGLVLYPNPVVGNDLSIGFTAARGQYNLSVVNAAGQQIYTQKINHSGGTVSQAITLPATIKSGVYSMQISGDNYKETKMFVIQ